MAAVRSCRISSDGEIEAVGFVLVMALALRYCVHHVLVPEAVVALGATTGEVGDRETLPALNLAVDVSSYESPIKAETCSILSMALASTMSLTADCGAGSFAPSRCCRTWIKISDGSCTRHPPQLCCPDAVVALNKTSGTWGSARCWLQLMMVDLGSAVSCLTSRWCGNAQQLLCWSMSSQSAAATVSAKSACTVPHCVDILIIWH